MQEEQFEETCALVREVGFDRVNTAAYSPRPATPAAEWGNQIADLVKADRLHRLNRIVNEVAEERAQRFVGTISEVRLPCCCHAACLTTMRSRAAQCARQQSLVRCLMSGMVPWGEARGQRSAGTTAEAGLLWCMRADGERPSAQCAPSSSPKAQTHSCFAGCSCCREALVCFAAMH